MHLAQAGKRKLVVAGKIVHRNGVGRGVEAALDLAEQESERVADLAICLADMREDLAVAGHVVGSIDGRDPQAHDVGAAGVAFLVRVDDVAERLGHLAALAVKREALRDDRLVGSCAVRAHRGHKRAHEPTAVLVGTFEVHICRELEVVAMLAHGGMRNARVPPHVEDVLVRLQVMAAAFRADARVAEVACGVVGEPAVGALAAEQCDNGVERRVVHDRFTTVLAGESGNGNAPIALAGDAPVRTALHHGPDALHGMRRVERDLRELVERLLAQRVAIVERFVHRDEPLARRAEDDRLLAAPAVRIAVVDVLVEDERAALAQPLDDLRVGLVDLHAGPGAARAHLVALVEATVVVNGHDHGNVELHADEVVVDAMAGSAMDDSGAVVQSDVVSVDELALDALITEDGLLVLVACQLDTGHAPRLAVGAAHELDLAVAELLGILLHERACHDLRLAVMDDRDVIGLGMQDDDVVGGQGPGGGGPDVDPELAFPGLEACWHRRHLEANEDGGADLIAVLDFRLGERRVAVRAPVDRLATAIDCAAIEDGLEDLDVGRIVVVHVGEVRVFPLGKHAQALEALALRVDLLDGHLATELADLLGGQLVELLGTEHGFDLVLDRLTVAVPAGHIGSAKAAHRLVAVDDVLRNLVLRVAEMNGAVRVRGAVVQDEGLSVLVLLLQLLVYMVLFPLREALGLVFREIAPHREVGSRQVHRFLVIARHKSGPAFPDRFLCKAHECAIRQTSRL